MSTKSFPYRILFVEDDQSLRETGALLLQSKGYEVLCAEDGFEGLVALKRSLPDIIISGLRMPNMKRLRVSVRGATPIPGNTRNRRLW